MFGIKRYFKKLQCSIKFRRLNPDNKVYLAGPGIGLSRISVGIGSYGPLRVETSSPNPDIKIGRFCSIADNVVFVTEDEHPINKFSTYPFKVMALRTAGREALSKGGIVLEDDVWVGFGATILDGVTIHQGAVVSAGAVVSKDVPPYAIVGGVPARLIKKRFSDEIIEKLLKFDYSNIDKKWIEEHLDQLYAPLDELILEKLLDLPGSGDEF